MQTPSGRSIEVFVSTQRLGGYVLWTKRRLQPATNRFAAIVLLADAEDPNVYLVPSTEWLRASPPLTDRDNVGKQSEPEYGISLGLTGTGGTVSSASSTTSASFAMNSARERARAVAR